MVFASWASKYRKTLQNESAQYFAPGQKNVLQPRVVARFRAGVPDYVVDAVQKKWPKMPVHHPRVGGGDGPVAWHSVISVWDSKEAQREYGWTDEQREQFERKMLSSAEYGVYFIDVTEPKVQAPWPGYDSLRAQGRRTIDHVVEKILEIVSETGINPANVVAYERQNLNRPEVLAALEGLAPQDPDPAEEVIAA